MLCFTASPPNDDIGRLEIEVYKHIGLKSFAYWPSRLKEVDRANIADRLPKMTEDAARDFILERAR